VVPYTRGAEISRPWADILAEAHALVEGGAREITLLGQNVNAWGPRGPRAAELIRAIAKIDGLERIRYTTSHPADMSDGLIATHGEVDKLMPYLHLPVQSGSDRILKAMNRSHSAESYLRTIEKVRRRDPTSPFRATSSSASPAKRTRISKRRSRSSMRSATLRPIRSNIAPARALRRRSWKSRSQRGHG
jgi:tRNA A37 methylthiotransferase MiaB